MTGEQLPNPFVKGRHCAWTSGRPQGSPLREGADDFLIGYRERKGGQFVQIDPTPISDADGLRLTAEQPAFEGMQGDTKVGTSEMLSTYLDLVRYGVKTRYYQNSLTGKDVILDSSDNVVEYEASSDDCEACKL